MRSIHLAAVALGVIALAAAARAGTVGTIAYDNTCPYPQCVGQYFGNALGLDFEVNQEIEILTLGFYLGNNLVNSGPFTGEDGESGVTVAIYAINSAGCGKGQAACGSPQLITSYHFTAGNFQVKGGPANPNAATLIDADAFMNVTPVALAPGFYSIVAYNDQNWNAYNTQTNPYTTLNGDGGAITFDGSGRWGYGVDPSIDFPLRVDGGPVDRYMAGTFMYTPGPEPATWVLMGAGLLGLGMLRRRRFRARAKD